MFNQEIFRGKWMEFKGGVRNIWGRLSDEDIERTRGNLSSLTGLIQTKYGEALGSVKNKLDRLLSSFDNESDRSKQDLNRSSYQRRPFDESESNFSIGRDFHESERNFNSSSEAVGGTKDFGVGTGATDLTDEDLHDRAYPNEEYGGGEAPDREDFQLHRRPVDHGEDRIARH